MRVMPFFLLLLFAPFGWATVHCALPDSQTRLDWPTTAFGTCSIDITEIISGGPGKDGIPSIDNPRYVKAAEETGLVSTEPVISLELDGQARAWPLRILTWHEIVNDNFAGLPIAVTYCPLCNAAVVFDRRVGDRVLDFGTTGRLRHSDLVMYDRQTESWWQQYSGEAIVGSMTSAKLTVLPARLESWGEYIARHPDGEVLVPNDNRARPYGSNPYVGYDSAAFPFLYKGEVPEGILPLARIVVVGDKAWSLDLLQTRKTIVQDDLKLTWVSGQNSALDTRNIAKGRDVGTVTAQRKMGDGWRDIPYKVTFAFVFHAFHPDKAITLR